MSLWMCKGPCTAFIRLSPFCFQLTAIHRCRSSLSIYYTMHLVRNSFPNCTTLRPVIFPASLCIRPCTCVAICMYPYRCACISICIGVPFGAFVLSVSPSLCLFVFLSAFTCICFLCFLAVFLLSFGLYRCTRYLLCCLYQL